LQIVVDEVIEKHEMHEMHELAPGFGVDATHLADPR
jgi:hypothetical protein